MPVSPTKDQTMGQKPCKPTPPVRTGKQVSAGKSNSTRATKVGRNAR